MTRSHPLAILLALAVLVVAACTTTPGASGSPSASPTGAQAGTLVIYKDVSDLISLDPAVVYEFSGTLLVHNAYETLVQFQGSDLSTLKPGLATKWDIKDTGGSWQVSFDLRSGAKFASGNPITADDVVYSIQRAIKLNKSPAFLYTDIAQLKPDSVAANGASSVVITMPKTASAQGLLSILTFTIGSVVDSKEVKSHETAGDFGSAWLLDHSAGSGPYVIDHWTKATEVQLKANPTASTKPALASILVKHVQESTNQQFALERGDADIAADLGPQQIAAVQGKAGVTTLKADSLQLVYVGINASMKPFDNVKIREALRTAIDYNGIVNDLLKGNAKKVQGIVPAGLAGHNADTPFQADVNKAKSLLADGGQPNGFSTELLVPTGPAPGGAQWSDVAAKLQNDWRQIGVNVTIKQTTQAELLTTYRAQKGQLVLILWGPDFPDPDANAGPFTDYAAKSIAWRNGWNDAAIADKARKAALVTDAAARNAAYKEITDYVLHNGPYAVLYQPTQNFGLRSNVKGFAWNPMAYADFAAITK
jgi:peptide/nickel transport system substrate-binding protein